jgi:hypothetical protein
LRGDQGAKGSAAVLGSTVGAQYQRGGWVLE